MSGRPNRFAVLLTGHAPVYSQAKYGGYGQMFINLLKELGETWDVFPVVDGVFPSPDDLDSYDGFVVTGSKHDAHGNDPWILKLCQIIQDLHSKRKKVLGVCFGHQVLSRALGGRTGRAPVGWELGARAIQVYSEEFSKKPYGKDLAPVLRIIESHQDQVLELPLGSDLLGSSRRTPIKIFAVGTHILCLQGHPEFEEDVVLDIIEGRLAMGIISEEVAIGAKASILDNNPDKATWQKLCRNFLKSC